MAAPMDQAQLLEQWHAGIRIAHVAHRFATTYYERFNRGLGLAAVISSAAVGTALFAGLQTTPDAWAQLLLGLVSIAAAVLSALMTFFNFAEKAENHKAAAARYGALRREYEQFLVTQQTQSTDTTAMLTQIRERWSLLDEESPTVPKRVYKEAQKAVAGASAGEAAGRKS